jgi:hypothetical protein
VAILNLFLFSLLYISSPAQLIVVCCCCTDTVSLLYLIALIGFESDLLPVKIRTLYPLRMASFFRFLGCFICESEKTGVIEIDEHAAVPVQVQYAKSIEGKDPQLCSDSSFDSEAELLSKDEKISIAQNVYDVQSVQVVPVNSPGPVLNERTRSNRALIVKAKGTYGFAEHPFPELEHEREVVIRNHATGLNPIDFKSVDYNFCLPEFPWVTGREMAGTVEHVGREVEREGKIRVDDRVWTSMFTSSHRLSPFPFFYIVE